MSLIIMTCVDNQEILPYKRKSLFENGTCACYRIVMKPADRFTRQISAASEERYAASEKSMTYSF
jgi:hypothetical protein